MLQSCRTMDGYRLHKREPLPHLREPSPPVFFRTADNKYTSFFVSSYIIPRYSCFHCCTSFDAPSRHWASSFRNSLSSSFTAPDSSPFFLAWSICRFQSSLRISLSMDCIRGAIEILGNIAFK